MQDMNADDKPDLVFQDVKSNKLYVWYMDGAARTGGQWLPSTSGSWRIVHSGAWSDLGAGGSSLGASHLPPEGSGTASSFDQSGGGCRTGVASASWILLLLPVLLMRRNRK